MSSQLRSLNTAPAATNTAIGRDGMEVYDGGVITIINGGLDVTGTATISGTLTGSGNLNWSGPVSVTGNVTTTGSLDVNGPMKTTSTLSVEGVTTLKNDLNVTTGGKIIAGGMTLDPLTDGGSMLFSGGGGIHGASGSTWLKGAGNAGLFSDDYVSIFAGSVWIDVKSDGVHFNGMPTTSSAANVYYDPTTKILYYKP